MNLQIGKTDGIVFVYNLAVVLTGVYVTNQLETTDRLLLFLVGLILATAWTVYFQFSMRSKLSEGDTPDQSRQAER